MKKILFTLLITFLFAGSSMAVTLPTLGGSYEWSNADYWTITDLSGSQALFQLDYENGGASYESSFGLYTVNQAGDEVASTYEIFEAGDEPSTDWWATTTSSIWFSYDNANSIWQISDAVDGTFVDFGLTFGFYSDVTYNGSAVDTWYTDVQFNTNQLERIFVAYDEVNHGTQIFLEDTQSGAAPLDMLVSSSDLQPVPEPGTLLLLGSGLVGLAFLKRRKS